MFMIRLHTVSTLPACQYAVTIVDYRNNRKLSNLIFTMKTFSLIIFLTLQCVQQDNCNLKKSIELI